MVPSGRRALLVVVIGIASYLMALKGNEPRRNRVLGEGKTPRLAAGLHNMPATRRYFYFRLGVNCKNTLAD